MKRFALALVLLIWSAAASLAQNVTVIGPITPGDCPQFSSTTVIKDSGFNCNGSAGGAITALTGDGTATGPGSVPFTLATVNANVGSFGSATQCVAFTTNGKGLITAASAVTCTPAVASITGLGAGVATALGIAVNASGGIVNPTPTRAGDVIYWNGSAWVTLAGNNSGTQTLTENASGVPSWSAAGSGSVTEQKNTASVGLVTSGNCDNTTTNAASPCNYALALTNTTLQASPTNPTGTSSASGVMMGLGTTCKLTPAYSGRIKLEFIGSITNSAATNTMTVKVFFGTSTAPTNGAATTGTQVGNSVIEDQPASSAAFRLPFTNGGIITGLSPGTAYWFDINITSGAGTTTATNISCNAMEF